MERKIHCIALLQQEGNAVLCTTHLLDYWRSSEILTEVQGALPPPCLRPQQIRELHNDLLTVIHSTRRRKLDEGELGPISIFMFCDDFKLYCIVMVCLYLIGSGGCSQGSSVSCPPAVTCSCV